jgi:hypothetical protein
MHKQFAFYLLLPAFAALTFSACKKDDKTEQELITTIELHFTGSNGFNQKFFWEDLDGDGGAAPSIDTVVLPLNAALNCFVHVYDKSKNPAEDITEEIQAEDAEHLFIYNSANDVVTINSTSVDGNGAPFRISSTWTTTGAGAGSVRVRLLHEADKSAADPAATGETDFDVTFPVVVR